jgi:hypothetical protein
MITQQAIKQFIGSGNWEVVPFTKFNHSPNKSFDFETVKSIKTDTTLIREKTDGYGKKFLLLYIWQPCNFDYSTVFV